jgi:glutamate dehydrogenase
MQNETGSSTAQIIRAYMVAATIFEAQELQTLIESLSHKIPFAMQVELLGHIRRLIYLSTRWFLRHKNLTNEDLQETINTFGTNVKLLTDLVPSLMGGFTKNYLDSLSAQFEKIGVSVEYARRIAATRAMYTSLNIIQVATEHHFDLTKTARVYFVVGEYFNLLWFRDKIGTDTREGIWETLARLTLRDELDILQKLITTSVMQQKSMPSGAKEAIDQWIAANPHAMERWEKILEMIHSSTSIDYSMFFIALRELSNLLHASELYA